MRWLLHHCLRLWGRRASGVQIRVRRRGRVNVSGFLGLCLIGLTACSNPVNSDASKGILLFDRDEVVRENCLFEDEVRFAQRGGGKRMLFREDSDLLVNIQPGSNINTLEIIDTNSRQIHELMHPNSFVRLSDPSLLQSRRGVVFIGTPRHSLNTSEIYSFDIEHTRFEVVASDRLHYAFPHEIKANQYFAFVAKASRRPNPDWTLESMLQHDPAVWELLFIDGERRRLLTTEYDLIDISDVGPDDALQVVPAGSGHNGTAPFAWFWTIDRFGSDEVTILNLDSLSLTQSSVGVALAATDGPPEWTHDLGRDSNETITRVAHCIPNSAFKHAFPYFGEDK